MILSRGGKMLEDTNLFDADEIFELKIKVVGVTYNNRQENIKKLHIGDELLLVLEPNNLYDKNAV